jgi:hypothetical protein
MSNRWEKIWRLDSSFVSCDDGKRERKEGRKEGREGGTYCTISIFGAGLLRDRVRGLSSSCTCKVISM